MLLEYIRIHRIYRIHRIHRIEPNIDFLVNRLESVNYRRIETNIPNIPNFRVAFRLTHGQRWAPGAYKLRVLGISLRISGHRTDLVQEISEPERDRAHTEQELMYP
jgi:hypothetical protein